MRKLNPPPREVRGLGQGDPTKAEGLWSFTFDPKSLLSCVHFCARGQHTFLPGQSHCGKLPYLTHINPIVHRNLNESPRFDKG